MGYTERARREGPRSPGLRSESSQVSGAGECQVAEEAMWLAVSEWQVLNTRKCHFVRRLFLLFARDQFRNLIMKNFEISTPVPNLKREDHATRRKHRSNLVYCGAAI